MKIDSAFKKKVEAARKIGPYFFGKGGHSETAIKAESDPRVIVHLEFEEPFESDFFLGNVGKFLATINASEASHVRFKEDRAVFKDANNKTRAFLVYHEENHDVIAGAYPRDDKFEPLVSFEMSKKLMSYVGSNFSSIVVSNDGKKSKIVASDVVDGTPYDTFIIGESKGYGVKEDILFQNFMHWILPPSGDVVKFDMVAPVERKDFRIMKASIDDGITYYFLFDKVMEDFHNNPVME